MNRYPVWKYAIILIALLVGGLYALPNVFGESPAVQVSVAKTGIKLDEATHWAGWKRHSRLLALTPMRGAGGVPPSSARFGNTDAQLKAKDAIQKALNPDPADPAYVVALNLLSRSPAG
jgi:preprotein translocase subunit SecD